MSASRRDFLASMLGVAAAQAACVRPAGRVAGSIRGPALELGHRLRDEKHWGEPARTEQIPALIVGAGPSGLAAGWRLDRLGEARFLVLDLEPEEGGTSRSGRDGVVPYPWGAHYVPVPRAENLALIALLQEMGALVGVDERGDPVAAEHLVVRDPEERHFSRKEWHDGLFPRELASADDLAQLARFQKEIERLARMRDGRGRRAFTIPHERGSDDAEFTALDRLSMAQWLDDRGLTSPVLRWYVDYACRDDYGLLARDTSAWAGLFYFASRMSPEGGESAELIAWPQGNGRLVEHLSAAVGARKRTGHLVVSVENRDTHAEVLAFDAARGELVRYEAGRVIMATPKFLARRIVRGLPAGWAGGFTYGAWMVANLHLTGHPQGPGVPVAWDNVLIDSPSLGYVVATHQAHRDEGPTVLTYYYPYTDTDADAGRRRLYEADHALIADLVMADLGPAHRRLAAQVERIDAFRWGHAMAQPRVGFVWGPGRREAAQPVGRVHMAHSDLSGLALFEEALHHGIRAAEEVFVALDPGRAQGLSRLS